MSRNDTRFTFMDGLKLLSTVAVIILVLIGIGKASTEYDRRERADLCTVEYETVDCLEKRIKKVQAKEAYEQKLQELNK
jgi:hypothetical protein